MATRWVDGLTVEGATVLARYQHPHFGRWPAITTREVGGGRLTCVGTVPGLDLARALMGWLSPAGDSGWRDLPATVTATGATARDGRRVRFLHNWSWEPASVRLPVALSDVLAGGEHAAGDSMQLGPWDVRVFVEA